MPKQKIYISDVKFVKSGSKNGKQWTLHQVLDQNANRYSTFSGNKYEAMKGTEVEIEYVESVSTTINQKTGQPYMNKTIVEPKRTASPDLEKRVADLEAIVKDLAKAVGVNTPAKTKEEFMASLEVPVEKMKIAEKGEDIDAEGVPF